MDQPSHLDPTLGIEQRVELLLAQMTTLEKTYQLASVPPWYLVNAAGGDSPDAAETLSKAPGHICNFGVDDPRTMADVVARMQRLMVEGTRLGIPLLVHAEALNGFLAGGHMVFPTPTGLAATWSPDLVEEMAAIIGRQMKRVGVRQALSPNMDVALDPRWGRVHETYGEDPQLVAAFAVAFTRGIQTPDIRDGVIATAKHFVGYGAPEAGINLAAYEGGPRRTRDLYAYPFEAAIQMAGLASVMNAYADVDGVPAGASRPVLTDLLRDTLGFEGFVSSDYSTLNHFVDRQHVARNKAEAARLAIRAGLDTEFPFPWGYGEPLAEEVEAGRADANDLDASVRRVLTAKFALGLFENPYPQEHIDLPAVAAEGKELSRELARRSVVLLKNDGILPLPKTASIALIGPHADAVTYQFATYSYPAFREMTTYMSSGGMGNMVGIDPGMAAWNNAVFSSTPVAEYVREHLDARSLAEATRALEVKTEAVRGSTLTTDLDDAERAAAVAAVAEADVIVLALGGASLWFNGERTEGEGSDSADISLPAAQVRLAEDVMSTGKPVVLVLTQGRAYALPPSLQDVPAIIVASYGGPFGPDAVAEVIFGDVNPSGKLPYSIPRHSGQIPVYHHQRSGTGYRNNLPPDVDEMYLDMPATPLYTFGSGIGYSTFEVSDLEVASEFTTTSSVEVSVRITNTSARAGATVAQLYVHPSAFGVTRPAQQLAGFVRIELDAGESRRVSFTLDASQLGYTNLSGDFVVDPGPLGISVGFDAGDHHLRSEIELTGPTRPLRADQRAFLPRVQVVDEAPTPH